MNDSAFGSIDENDQRAKLRRLNHVWTPTERFENFGLIVVYISTVTDTLSRRVTSCHTSVTRTHGTRGPRDLGGVGKASG